MMTPNSNAAVPFNLLMEVKLEARQWNEVLAALGKTPYEVAAPLIQAINEQLQLQAQAHQQQPQAGNGLAISETPGAPS